MSGRRSSKAGRKSGRHFWRVRLLDQRQAARDRARVAPQQSADVVLLLLNTAFEIWNTFSGSGDQLLRLALVKHVGRATVYQGLGQLQRLFASSQCSARDLQLQVQRTKLEIRSSDIAHQRRDDVLPRPACRNQICACGFGGASVFSPEVKLPVEARIQLRLRWSPYWE